MNQNAARGWAYAGIALGGVASIAMNVSSTVHQVSAVSLWLRIPGAIFWPVAVYIGVEILTRTLWRRTWTHILARLVLIAPVAGVAAVVSYLHGKHMLALMGEIRIVYTIGPAAIDGLLFGAAFVLLITAGGRDEGTARKSLAERVAGARESVLAVKDAAAGRVAPIVDTAEAMIGGVNAERAEAHRGEAERLTAVDRPETDFMVETMRAIETALPRRNPAPIEPVTEDLGDVIQAPDRPAPRNKAASWDRGRAVALLQGGTDAEIAAEVGTSSKTIQRLRREQIEGLTKDTLMTDAEIGAAMNVTTARVAGIRRQVRADLGLS